MLHIWIPILKKKVTKNKYFNQTYYLIEAGVHILRLYLYNCRKGEKHV